MARFEQALSGIVKYINREMMPGMVDWQKLAARTLISRIYRNKEGFKQMLVKNPLILAFGVVDESGNVDVSGIASDLKDGMAETGKISLSIPLFGKYTFYPADIDKLVLYIQEDAS